MVRKYRISQIQRELKKTKSSIWKIRKEGVLSTGRNKRYTLLLKKVECLEKRLQKALAYAAPQGSPISLSATPRAAPLRAAPPVLRESSANPPGSPIRLDPATPRDAPPVVSDESGLYSPWSGNKNPSAMPPWGVSPRTPWGSSTWPWGDEAPSIMFPDLLNTP